MRKRILVCGAGGFIGGHLVKRFKEEGAWVRGADLKRPEFSASQADEFIVGDLRDPHTAARSVEDIEVVYQLAADMGGAGYIFTGEHDAALMHNSAMINLNILEHGVRAGVRKFFYSSSACIYPEHNQRDPESPNCAEDSAYPASPDSEYGWEKLFSERLYRSFMRNYGISFGYAISTVLWECAGVIQTIVSSGKSLAGSPRCHSAQAWNPHIFGLSSNCASGLPLPGLPCSSRVSKTRAVGACFLSVRLSG